MNSSIPEYNTTYAIILSNRVCVNVNSTSRKLNICEITIVNISIESRTVKRLIGDILANKLTCILWL